MTPKEKPKKKSAAQESAGAEPPAATPKPAYLTFARKWRPQTFSEVVGQTKVVSELRRALEQGRIANAYLFCGPRGTGKTSMARILAKSLNCAQGITSEPCGACDSCRAITAGVHLDVVEIDGASYTKTEQIQDFLEGINRNPFSAKFKIYIIDEVHMLSAASFNRLLKTLEEPPEFVVFILATTNAEKIPATIISRCQVQEFRAIEAEDIKSRLAWIAEQEGIALDPESRDAIFDTLAHHAEGGLRDASVALDQLINLCDGQLTLDAAQQLLGLVDRDILFQTMERLQSGDTAGLMEIVDQLARKGRNMERFAADLLGLVRDALLAKSRRDASLLQGRYTAARIQWFADNLAQWDYAYLLNLANQLLWAQEKMKTSANPRFLLEFAFIKLTAMQETLSVDRLADRLRKLAASPMPMAAGGNQAQPVATAAEQQAGGSASAATKPAAPGGQTALFNHQGLSLDFMNGLGLRGAGSGAAPMLTDVLRDGAAAPAPLVREEAAATPNPTAAIDLTAAWAATRQLLAKKHPFLNNHLDDVRPLAMQGRRIDLGMIKNSHTEYNMNYATSAAKAVQLGDALAAVLGFAVTIRWQEISAEQAAVIPSAGPAMPSSATPAASGAVGAVSSVPSLRPIAPPAVQQSAAPAVLHDAKPLASASPAASPFVMPPSAPVHDDIPDASSSDHGLPESAEAALYSDVSPDDGGAEDAAPSRPAAESGPPRTMNEAFARYPEFKSAVTRMQRLMDGEIVGFKPA